MDQIADEVTRQLGVAVERWNDLHSRGLHNVGAAALVDVHAALAAAIEAVPLKSPYHRGVDTERTDADLRKQVRHLAAVAGALRGLSLGGTVSSDPTPLHFNGANGYGLFRVNITRPIDGWVAYVHVADGEIKKAGMTRTFDRRMGGSYNCLRKVIAAGPPYLGDPWKRNAPTTILAGQTVELWAKAEPSYQAAGDTEDILNEFYRGEWSKEGWKSGARRPSWPAELNERRARLNS
jgi:hypothetical protein